MRTMDLSQALFPARTARRHAVLLLLLTLTAGLPVAWTETTAPVSAPKAVATKHGSKTHAARSKAKAGKEPTPSATSAAAPATPKLPNWPVNDKPSEATVVWNSDGLRIAANNASLRQIINDVAQATGATIEGAVPEERVYGDYGPGKARDVLSKLLGNASYNILLIGDQGSGTPRRIVINAQADGTRAAYAAPSQAKKDDEDEEEEIIDEDHPQPPQQSQPAPGNRHNGPQGGPQGGGQNGQGGPPQGTAPNGPPDNNNGNNPD